MYYTNTRTPGVAPALLPHRLRLSSGLTRTDPASFTPAEIADAGYTVAPQPPVIDSTQVADWVNNAWVVRSLTPREKRERGERPQRLSRFEFMSIMTADERKAIRKATATDAVLNDAMGMLELAMHIDVQPLNPMVEQTLGYMQSIALMSAARVAEFKTQIAAAVK